MSQRLSKSPFPPRKMRQCAFSGHDHSHCAGPQSVAISAICRGRFGNILIQPMLLHYRICSIAAHLAECKVS